MSKPQKGLGRGLDALLSAGSSEKDDVLRELKVSQLKPGKYQPRSHMDSESLNELAASIKAQGIMQPILVREMDDENYEIIAGERRWRASQIAGLTHVPVLVRSVPDNVALAMALIENIQRENLNPLEEAAGIQRLIDEFEMTHQLAADAVGRSRSAASNLLRLLKLPQDVQNMMLNGKLDMGHARALLGLDNGSQIAVANKICMENLSVRETEKLIQKLQRPEAEIPKKKNIQSRDVIRLQDELSECIGANVTIKEKKKGAGQLVIEFSSHEQLEELIVNLQKNVTRGG